MVENSNWSKLGNAFLGYKTAIEQKQKEDVLEQRKKLFLLRAHQYITEVKKLDKKNHKVVEVVELTEQIVEVSEKYSNDISRITEIITEIGRIRGNYGKNLPEKKPGFFASLFGKKPQQANQGAQ